MQSAEVDTRSRMLSYEASPLAKAFKSFLPITLMLLIAPQFYTFWFIWRVLSVCLPSWIYQKGDDMIFSSYLRLVVYFYEHFTHTELRMSGDTEEVLKNKERVLYISNHQSTVDWIIAAMISLRQGSAGHVRFVMKDQLAYWPIYGSFFYQHGCIFVRRGKFEPEKMMRGLNYLQHKQISSWVVIFPEGTRFNPECESLVKNNKEFAESQGLQLLSHCLIPKTKGFQMMLAKLRDNVDAIYDVTVIYESALKNGQRMHAPSMPEFLTLDRPKIRVHINRIPISSVPTSESDVKKWLHKIFVNKDRIMSNFYDKDSEHKNADQEKYTCPKLSIISTLPAAAFLTSATLYTMFATPLGYTLYWKIFIFHSVIGYVWLLFRYFS